MSGMARDESPGTELLDDYWEGSCDQCGQLVTGETWRDLFRALEEHQAEHGSPLILSGPDGRGWVYEP